MPRDLFGSRHLASDSDEVGSGNEVAIALSKEGGTMKKIHPLVQVLSLHDLESCVAVENAAFPENERCSREKVNVSASYVLHSIF